MYLGAFFASDSKIASLRKEAIDFILQLEYLILSAWQFIAGRANLGTTATAMCAS